MTESNTFIDPFHISARSNNKEWFYIPQPEAWEIMSNYLYFMRFAFEVKIHSFVLMANHFHLIAQFPKGNMGEAMNYFMRETSRYIGSLCGRINHIYGNRYFRSQISRYDYYVTAYKYIYRNPVEAKLVGKVEDYPFSTLHGLLGQSKMNIPVEDDTLLFDNPTRVLAWLNSTPAANDQERVRKALRRKKFQFPKGVDDSLPLDNFWYWCPDRWKNEAAMF